LSSCCSVKEGEGGREGKEEQEQKTEGSRMETAGKK